MSQVNAPIETFRSIADAISAKYLAEVQLMAAEQGARPSFDDLMVLLKRMEKDLTSHGLKFMESNKGAPQATADLTDRVKEIIRTCIEGFIRQL